MAANAQIPILLGRKFMRLRIEQTNRKRKQRAALLSITIAPPQAQFVLLKNELVLPFL
tara:strand:+ start:306 stop:479 length:174 start_codon:yes stop_codon:yes gene_type:complete